MPVEVRRLQTPLGVILCCRLRGFMSFSLLRFLLVLWIWVSKCECVLFFSFSPLCPVGVGGVETRLFLGFRQR